MVAKKKLNKKKVLTKKKVVAKNKPKPQDLSFQEVIFKLQKFWSDYGCVVMQPYDMEVGAGTFHPATTLRSLPNLSFKITCRVPTPSIKPSCKDFFPDQNSPENNIE